MKHWQKRLPNLEKAALASDHCRFGRHEWQLQVELLLVIMDNTATVEKDFAVMRLLKHDQKGSVKAEFLKNALKARQDTPDDSTFSSFVHGRYVLGSFGLQVSAKYRSLFGGSSNGPQSDLPRRQMRPRTRGTGMAALLRSKEEQKTRLGHPEDQADDLSALTAAEAERRVTVRQKHLAESLKVAADRKRQLVDNFEAEAQKKLKEHLKSEQKLLQVIQSMERRDLQRAPEVAPNADILVILVEGAPAGADGANNLGASQCHSLADASRMLARLGLTHVVNTSHAKLAKMAVEARDVWWVACNPMGERMLLPNEKEKGLGLLSGVCRLLGGHLATAEWLTHCVESNRVVQPLMKVQRAVSTPQEVCFHKSLPFREGLLKTVAACESRLAGDCAWVVRHKPMEVRLPELVKMSLISGISPDCCTVGQGPARLPGLWWRTATMINRR